MPWEQAQERVVHVVLSGRQRIMLGPPRNGYAREVDRSFRELLFSSLRGPLCAGEAFGQAPARPCLYVKPAGAPSGLLGKVLLAALRARQKQGLDCHKE